MPDATTGVEVAHLTKVYGEHVVLNDVNFDVAAGQAMAVIGPAGAGKTTLARILATAEPPTRGVVRIMGYHTRRRPLDARAVLGYLPAQAGLDPDLTVEEYLEFFLRAYDRDDAAGEATMADVLEVADLTERRHESVGALEPAAGRKLGLARCLLHDPRVLILDEPMAELDAGGRREVHAVLEALREMGKTLVLFSRAVQAVADLANEFCILDHGVACEVGSRDELERWHAPAVLCEFLVRGDARLAARIVNAGGGLVLLRDRQRLRCAVETEDRIPALESQMAAGGLIVRSRRLTPAFEDVIAACYARRAKVMREAAALIKHGEGTEARA